MSCVSTQIKGFLQRHQLLAEHETKVAIADGILEITHDNPGHFFTMLDMFFNGILDSHVGT